MILSALHWMPPNLVDIETKTGKTMSAFGQHSKSRDVPENKDATPIQCQNSCQANEESFLCVIFEQFSEEESW
jgi:hypothetical protein